jgi:hypothetical protein
MLFLILHSAGLYFNNEERYPFFKLYQLHAFCKHQMCWLQFLLTQKHYIDVINSFNSIYSQVCFQTPCNFCNISEAELLRVCLVWHVLMYALFVSNV